MTLFVAICDDEKKIGAELESALIGMLGKLDIKHEIDIYYTGEELCSHIENGTHYDLIFLDIVFAKNEINGIEVGRFIREKYRHDSVSIVYISWEMKYSMQLFDTHPLNFLIKPLDYEKLTQVVKMHLDIAECWSRDFIYQIRNDIFKVQIKSIIYLKSEKRKLILYLADGKKEEFYGILKEVYEEQLKKSDFLLIHASYAVNYDYIAVMKFNEVILTNSEQPLPISRAKRNEVREAYCAIIEKRMVWHNG